MKRFVNAISLGIAFGVFWHIWGIYGFWWGLLYGFFWVLWVGYKLSAYVIGIGGC
jgi:hypothetical protein